MLASHFCTPRHEWNDPRVPVFLLRPISAQPRTETWLEETAYPASTDTVHGRTVSHDCRVSTTRLVYLWHLVRTHHDLVILQFLLSSLPQREGKRKKNRLRFFETVIIVNSVCRVLV